MTRGSNFALALFAILSLAACAAPGRSATIDEAFLSGTWQVDLRPTPDAAPYFQELVITEAGNGSMSGTFYGAPFSEGRINDDWGTLRIAFVTADGSGPYYHSAVLNDGRLEGLSHSSGRDFLAYWSATKREVTEN